MFKSFGEVVCGGEAAIELGVAGDFLAKEFNGTDSVWTYLIEDVTPHLFAEAV